MAIDIGPFFAFFTDLDFILVHKNVNEKKKLANLDLVVLIKPPPPPTFQGKKVNESALSIKPPLPSSS